MSTLQIGDVVIGYDDAGGGEALLLVHGHPFRRSLWRPQTECFSGLGWRVLAPDLRGYGQSSVTPGTVPLSAFAGDLAGLLDALAVDRAVVCGMSMGGQIALEFARLFPDRVRALVLAGVSAKAETESGRQARRSLADRLVAEGMDSYAREVLPMMVAPRSGKGPVAAEVLAMMRATPPEGAAAALRGRAERPDYRALLPGIAAPTLVIVGELDAFTPLAEARLIQESVPGAALHVIEQAGHLPNLEQPTEFNEALRHFLDTTTRTADAR